MFSFVSSQSVDFVQFASPGAGFRVLVCWAWFVTGDVTRNLEPRGHYFHTPLFVHDVKLEEQIKVISCYVQKKIPFLRRFFSNEALYVR